MGPTYASINAILGTCAGAQIGVATGQIIYFFMILFAGVIKFLLRILRLEAKEIEAFLKKSQESSTWHRVTIAGILIGGPIGGTLVNMVTLFFAVLSNTLLNNSVIRPIDVHKLVNDTKEFQEQMPEPNRPSLPMINTSFSNFPSPIRMTKSIVGYLHDNPKKCLVGLGIAMSMFGIFAKKQPEKITPLFKVPRLPSKFEVRLTSK